MEYSEKTRGEFHEYLEKQNLNLSEKAEHFLLKRRLLRYRKRPLYDLEFDKQLSAASEMISAK